MGRIKAILNGSSLCVFMLFPLQAWAEPPQLDGEGIQKLLPTVIVLGEKTKQTFSKAGATTYINQGRESFGSWSIRDNAYCSQWPPARQWDC